MKFRMYVDELEDSDLVLDPNHRYLRLTGVVLEMRLCQTSSPSLEG